MVGLTFRERMSGPFVLGTSDAADAVERGRRAGWVMTLHATVRVTDIDTFVHSANPRAEMSGSVTMPGVAEPVPFTGGVFELFPSDGEALMRYYVPLDEAFGERGRFHLAGVKCWRDKPVLHRMWSDTTRLEVTLHRGRDAGADVVGAGQLRIGFVDFLAALVSMRATGARTPAQVLRAVGAYGWLFARKLSEAYLPGNALPR
ncbi:hypothetical protein [Thermocrispum municipale]|jgi:hypothetical protein|uniref:hypothetical protein n=1 Tax=Thermocrispum municipale TaxID=37926 RepID=UPI00048D8ECC|nr:hypothetical protein [Thermocrispum municipale]